MIKRLKSKYWEIRRLYELGKRVDCDPYFIEAKKLTEIEKNKKPLRTDIINFILARLNRETIYLEIGVRNPEDNFNYINAKIKYSVDPGLEYVDNPVDFPITSDDFFKHLDKGKVLAKETLFDVIFIDGLHLADQAYRDIQNSLRYIKEDGFILLHDCIPPTEWHARENYEFHLNPAEKYWCGTTWKAFYKIRLNPKVSSCCIDADWGIGVITKKPIFNSLEKNDNVFFELYQLKENLYKSFNLIDYNEFCKKLTLIYA